MNAAELREQVCDFGRRLYARGLVAGSEGNITVRLDDTRFLCTPTLMSKGFMAASDLAVIDGTGWQLEGSKPRSSEALLHLAIYRRRPDVRAVIHAHPPHATAFSLLDEGLPSGFHPEQEVFLGPVPTVPYALTGTPKLAEAVESRLDRTSALLLANHGAVTFGPNLETAWLLMEALEAYSRLVTIARQLGTPRRLTQSQVDELLDLKLAMGLPDPRLGDQGTPASQDAASRSYG
jgi:L-fuculose-phosphate aldolase